MSSEFDISAFIPKFIEENRERIQKLNRTVLAFEKTPSNPELLKEIMRDVHTLKGTARIMGFSDVVALSHKVEDMFVKMREGSLPPAKAIYDVIFQALDMLANMVEEKHRNARDLINIEGICSRIDDALQASGSPETSKELSQQEVDSILSNPAKKEALVSAESQPPPQPSSLQQTEPKGAEAVSEETVSVQEAPPGVAAREDKKSIRIGLDKVDTLYNLLVELIMAQMAFRQRYEDAIRLNHSAKQLSRTKKDLQGRLVPILSNNSELYDAFTQYTTAEERLMKEVPRYSESYEADVVKLDAITEGIRQQVMFMRMQPLSAIFDLAPRLVRDLSRQFDKEVDLVVSGAEVELDNAIIEMLKDPLVHILRNAVDHGIEEPAVRVSRGKKPAGVIALGARQDGGDIVITIEDDGNGIDKDRVKETAVRKGLLSPEKAKTLPDAEIYGFIMKPGFSTSAIITDTSGRGVGMDVVKNVVDRLNGNLILDSQKGLGSKIIIRVPATIALINVLMVRVGDMTIAVPSANIEQIAHFDWKDVKTLEGKASVFMQGHTVPVIHMADVLLPKKAEEKNGGKASVILSQSYGKKIGFVVNEFLCEKEVVVREFKGYLKRPRYFSGVTTLGTGEVVLILNIQELVRTKDFIPATLPGEISTSEKPRAKKYTVLIAEDSIITAEMEKNILINAGYRVDVAVDGIDAMSKLLMKQYDLLVTDVDMPRMNGFELTDKVKKDKRLKEIPVIVVTVRESVEDKRKGIEVGADAYIMKKEFDQSTLLDTIKKLIGE